MTPEQRLLRAKLGAHASWAKTKDRAARTAAARQALADSFEREVDPQGKLTPEERAIRAEHARKAYYTRLAFLASRARSAKSAKRAS